MSLTDLQSFVLKSKTIHIYRGDDITVNEKEKPKLKDNNAERFPLVIHAITAAQMDHVQTVRNSVTPPPITRIVDGISVTEENFNDTNYIIAQAKASNLSLALIVYYGCDSIREDVNKSASDDNTDEARQKKAQTILNTLPLPLITDISNQIISINHPGLSADFFSAGSSGNTPS